MSSTTPMLAYGNLLVSSSPTDGSSSPTDGIDVRFAVFRDRIKFYHPPSSAEPTDFFSLVEKEKLTGAAGHGHITLISLSALAFDQVTLQYNAADPKSFSLIVDHDDPFSHQAEKKGLKNQNIYFKNLKLKLTEMKAVDQPSVEENRVEAGLTEKKAAGELLVEGKVEAVLFDQVDKVIPLEAELLGTALVFKNSGQLPPSIEIDQIEIDQLGTVSLTNFQVGTVQGGRKECQVLYTFDENSGDVVHDRSGVGEPLDLKIHDQNDPKAVEWLPGGLKTKASTKPTLLASEGSATKIIDEIRRTNEITVEAWVTPANTTQDGPARIVSISADIKKRNLTLGQVKGVYDVRLRNTKKNINGTHPSTSTPNKTLTTDRTHVVYTFMDGLARIYLNGVEVVKKKVEGDLSNWDDNYKLALANELTKDRQWHGELHQIAIYNRALTREEIQRNYFPTILARGTMTLADVPAPLNEPTKKVEFAFLPDQDLPSDLSGRNLFSISRSGARRYELYVAEKKEITPSLHVKGIDLVWQKAQAIEPWTLSGKVTAVLWEKLSLELTAPVEEKDGGIRLIGLRQINETVSAQLDGLGELSISKLVLKVDQAKSVPAWKIDAKAEITFSGMPRPLVGPFDGRPSLDQGQLRLKLEEIKRINLARDFRLSKITLGFVRDQNGWSGSGTAYAELFGGQFLISTSVTNGDQTENRVSLKIGHIGNLIELMPPVGSSGPLAYDFGPMRIKAKGAVLSENEYPKGWWNADDTAKFVESAGVKVTPALKEKLGSLSLIWFDRNSSKAVDDNAAITLFVGNWKVAKFVDLKVCLGLTPSSRQGYGNGFSIEGYLAKDKISDFVAFSAVGRIIRKYRDPVQLEGKSSLKVLGKEIFSGDIQQDGEKFLLNGQFNLFPEDWSPLQLESAGEVQITDDGRVTFEDAAKFAFPEFDLIGPELELQNGSLRLHGQWLGQAITLTGIRRDAHFILQGDVTFRVPFSLTLGPIYEPQTGVKVADSISVYQGEDCWQTMTMKVVVELSPAGFVAKVNGEFDWQDKTNTIHAISVPELTLYTPPTNQNAILSLIVDEVKAQANQLFAGKVKHAADYFFTTNQAGPLVYCGSNFTDRPGEITSVLPAIFEVPLSSSFETDKDIFRLEPLTNPPGQRLVIRASNVNQKRIQADSEDFLAKLKHHPGVRLLPDAAKLIKTRIAEQLHLSLDRVLYYYPNGSDIVSFLPDLFNPSLSASLESSEGVFILETLTETGHQLVIRPSKVDFDQKKIQDDYKKFLTQLDEAKLLPGAANLIMTRIAERLPMALDRVLYYYYGFNPTEGYLDLKGGMRLRVDYQNYQFVSPSDQTASNGFVGSGSSYYQLHSYLDDSDANRYLLGFDSFLSCIQSTVTNGVVENGAGGIVDLLDPAYRRPYYRLFYPARFSGAAGRNGAERAVSLIGADSLTAMQAATGEYLDENGELQGSDNSWVSLYFRGRATVIPEITVFVREQPLYVPVGTTVRQLIERYSNIPAALPGQDLGQFQGAFRPRRLIHEGVNSTPSYRFINYNQVQAISSDLDEFDLPVVKGDRFYF